MTPKEKAATVREIARLAFLDALEILQLIEVMEGQNRGFINEHISEAGAGGAGLVVRNGLVSRITLLVTRCFAKPRTDDMHLRRGFELMDDPETRAEIETHGSKTALTEAMQLFDQALEDSGREPIKHFRDKRTAHLAKTDPEIPMVSYTEFFEFARKTTRIMERLAHGVGGTKETLTEHADAFAGAATEFWRPWN